MKIIIILPSSRLVASDDTGELGRGVSKPEVVENASVDCDWLWMIGSLEESAENGKVTEVTTDCCCCCCSNAKRPPAKLPCRGDWFARVIRKLTKTCTYLKLHNLKILNCQLNRKSLSNHGDERKRSYIFWNDFSSRVCTHELPRGRTQSRQALWYLSSWLRAFCLVLNHIT